MKNCLILGSGRSGTSMTAGSLADAGYFMGEMYLRAKPGNPKGYFEGREVNGINERILARNVPGPPLGKLGWTLFPRRFRPGQRWLARLPIESRITADEETTSMIRDVVKNIPFCLKDPRFCYTLPVWRPHLPADTVFVCVFRHPALTADSIVRECEEGKGLWNLKVDYDFAIQVWTLMYRHVLKIHRHKGDWLFLHFNQLIEGDGLERLGQFLDAPVNRDFPEKKISRAKASHDAPAPLLDMYHELCRLANHKPGEWRSG